MSDNDLDLLEDVEELDQEFESQIHIYPWSLFPDKTDRIKDDIQLRIEGLTTLYSKSPIPTCILDLNLSIIWMNDVFQNDLNFNSEIYFRHIPELFRNEDGKILSAILKDTLENEDNAFSWKGRLIPFSDTVANTYLRAIIQPLYIEDDGLPMAYTVQWDVITNEYKRLLQATFLSLLEASKLKDNDTGDHIQRVNEYSKLLAENLKGKQDFNEVNNDFIEDIGFLASMHDVGKIGTPDDILNKKGPLDDWEREIMNDHTKNGAYILNSYPNPMAKDIALSHHEKWDGTGYPYAIYGEEIPLCSRIVSIADIYDALRSSRSYKDAFSHEKSVTIMQEGRGKNFDPRLLDLFLEIQTEFANIYENSSK